MNFYGFFRENGLEEIECLFLFPLSPLNLHLLIYICYCFLSCAHVVIMPICDNKLLSQFQIRNCCYSIGHETCVT